MEFALSQEQQMLQKSVADCLTNVSNLDKVRKAAGGDNAVIAHTDKELSGLGVAAMAVPEEFDGLGMGLVEAALVQEALGGSVSPARFTSQILAITAFQVAGSDEQKSNFLPQLASGEVRCAIALNEFVGARDGAGVKCAQDRLNGTALFTMDVPGATHILVSDGTGNMFLVGAEHAGIKRTDMGTIDKTRNFTELKFTDVPAEQLSSEKQLGAAAYRCLYTGRLLMAADILGASQYMLNAAVEYAKQREQFGRVIGSFQAVKHLCAEMAAKLEPCRALVWHAAYALQTGDEEGPLMACLAKSHLSDVGTFVARTATEVHGGMGFTDLVGLHYWFKRIGANRQLLGGPEKVRADAAQLQGFGNGS